MGGGGGLLDLSTGKPHARDGRVRGGGVEGVGGGGGGGGGGHARARRLWLLWMTAGSGSSEARPTEGKISNQQI